MTATDDSATDNSATDNPIIWSIAGSDCSCGAGIQADNQVFRSFDLAFANIITAVTAQNSQAVQRIQQLDSDMLLAQWQSLAVDMPANVIKLGMIGSDDLIQTLSTCLQTFKGWVVCDPVLMASNGDSLMKKASAYHALLPHIDVLTPNLSEFKALFPEDMDRLGIEQAALTISERYQLCVIITGGDLNTHASAIDIIAINHQLFRLSSPFIKSPHTHGTGCSFASALASCLALDYRLKDALILAKSYINQGLNLPKRADYAPAAFQHSYFPNQLTCLPRVIEPTIETGHQFSRLTRPLGLYVLVDNLDTLQRCLDAGVQTVQLRLKSMPEQVLDEQIQSAINLAKTTGTPLFINDHWQLAIKHGAFGVHLGQEDLNTADLGAIKDAGLKLGISTHNWFEIVRAHGLKPSYIALGPIFPTQTKKLADHNIPLKTLQSWVALLHNEYPLTAIGGINLDNIQQVVDTGIQSVAVVSAIKQADQPEAVITEFKRWLK